MIGTTGRQSDYHRALLPLPLPLSFRSRSRSPCLARSLASSAIPPALSLPPSLPCLAPSRHLSPLCTPPSPPTSHPPECASNDAHRHAASTQCLHTHAKRKERCALGAGWLSLARLRHNTCHAEHTINATWQRCCRALPCVLLCVVCSAARCSLPHHTGAACWCTASAVPVRT